MQDVRRGGGRWRRRRPERGDGAGPVAAVGAGRRRRRAPQRPGRPRAQLPGPRGHPARRAARHRPRRGSGVRRARCAAGRVDAVRRGTGDGFRLRRHRPRTVASSRRAGCWSPPGSSTSCRTSPGWPSAGAATSCTAPTATAGRSATSAIGVLATDAMAVHQALLFRQLSDDVAVVLARRRPSPPTRSVERLAARGIRSSTARRPGCRGRGDALRRAAARRRATCSRCDAIVVVAAVRGAGRVPRPAGPRSRTPFEMGGARARHADPGRADRRHRRAGCLGRRQRRPTRWPRWSPPRRRPAGRRHDQRRPGRGGRRRPRSTAPAGRTTSSSSRPGRSGTRGRRGLERPVNPQLAGRGRRPGARARARRRLRRGRRRALARRAAAGRSPARLRPTRAGAGAPRTPTAAGVGDRIEWRQRRRPHLRPPDGEQLGPGDLAVHAPARRRDGRPDPSARRRGRARAARCSSSATTPTTTHRAAARPPRASSSPPRTCCPRSTRRTGRSSVTEVRVRTAAGHDGEPVTVRDSVLRARRRG